MGCRDDTHRQTDIQTDRQTDRQTDVMKGEMMQEKNNRLFGKVRKNAWMKSEQFGRWKCISVCILDSYASHDVSLNGPICNRFTSQRKDTRERDRQAWRKRQDCDKLQDYLLEFLQFTMWAVESNTQTLNACIFQRVPHQVQVCQTRGAAAENQGQIFTTSVC